MNGATRFPLIFCASLLLTVDCATAADWIVVPGKRFGPITRDMSEEDIAGTFGAENARPSRIEVGEGITEPGTVLFPDDSTRRAYILWQDPSTRRSIARIIVRWDRTIWQTDKGVTIGTSMKAVEKLNGRPFILSGFAYDYAGTIIHSNGGRLAELGAKPDTGTESRTLILRFDPGHRSQGTAEYASVVGDRYFSSGHPAMQELNPLVYEFIFGFSPI